jgi:exodeoxyribonuclease V alpha subunit
VTLDALREARAIDGLDHAFARLLGRRAPGLAPEVLLAAALASRAPTHGHAAVDLATAGDLLARERDPEVTAPLPDLPALPDWLRALSAAEGVVRSPTDARPAPLVLDGTLLYLDRTFRQEAALAAIVRERSTRIRGDVDPTSLAETLAALFPPDPASSGPDLQRRAAEAALRRGFTVIAGGPGTGKTATVVKIVELLRRHGPAAPRVVMVAPTGKAAARLSDAVRGSGIEASTIHRALGLGPHLGADDPVEPLAADLVVVDEASMVDLSLMTRLLGAIPPHTRVVLLGDPDQLASVEHGSVLRDLCEASGAVADSVARLERSWRFDPGGGIARLARAVNAGDADAALAVLDDPRLGDVRRVDASEPHALERALRDLAVEAHRPVVAARTPQEALQALGRFRVLCAHRRGLWGVERLGPQLEQWLAAAGLIEPDGPFYAHQPVMVLENDERVRLFNGDTGVVRAVGGALRAFVPGAGAGEVRDFAPARLPRTETVYASTVHKSQGSEYGHVVVVLPDEPSPIVTRELLYTAITRASREVTVIGSEAVVRGGVAARTERVTGLRRRLSG